MKVSDLRTGMLLVLLSGDKKVVLKDTEDYSNWEAVAKSLDGPQYFPMEDSDFSDKHKDIGIIKVFSQKYAGNLLSPDLDDYNLIWEREPEIIELTIDEIAELKGVKPSQIKIKR